MWVTSSENGLETAYRLSTLKMPTAVTSSTSQNRPPAMMRSTQAPPVLSLIR